MFAATLPVRRVCQIDERGQQIRGGRPRPVFWSAAVSGDGGGFFPELPGEQETVTGRELIAVSPKIANINADLGEIVGQLRPVLVD